MWGLRRKAKASLSPLCTIRYSVPVSHFASGATLGILNGGQFLLCSLRSDWLWRKLSAASASSGGLDEPGVESAARNRGAREACSSEGPPRCVAGFDPLLQIQTVGARSAPRARGCGCRDLWLETGLQGYLWLHRTLTPAPPFFSEAASLLRGCWVSTGELARLHLRLG